MIPTLSYISVSYRLASCFRHWCSSRYLRISPLHREFHLPLRNSRTVVLNAGSGLSPEISHPTYHSAYIPFTPSDSEQRLNHTYYRGCWHVFSRFCQQVPSFFSSLSIVVYNPKTVIPHAVSLHQAFAHCARFLTAASRRSLDRISVPMWPFTLSGRLPIVALVGFYPTNKLIGCRLLFRRPKSFLYPCRNKDREYAVLPLVSQGYPPPKGRLPTCYSPVCYSCIPKDLTVQLACLKRTASVSSEPGSNSPLCLSVRRLMTLKSACR